MTFLNLKPERLVEMALMLLDLAGSLNQDASANGPGLSESDWSGTASAQWAEEMGPLLASVASNEYRAREYRDTLLGADLFGEPAWEMLLDLFIRMVEGKRTSVTSLCLASRAPSTTALRYISELEKRGMIIRTKSDFDQRTSYLSLSNETFVKVGACLRRRYATSASVRTLGREEGGRAADRLLADQG